MLQKSNVTACNYCATVHQFINPGNGDPMICSTCRVCYAQCEHTTNCHWPDEKKNEEREGPLKRGDVEAIPSSIRELENMRDAFVSWYLSSELVKDQNDMNAAKAWNEFECLVKQILTPVDKAKRYLQMEVAGDGEIKSFKFINGDNLFIDQTGEYVQVDGKKRVRLGKDVAVM